MTRYGIQRAADGWWWTGSDWAGSDWWSTDPALAATWAFATIAALTAVRDLDHLPLDAWTVQPVTATAETAA